MLTAAAATLTALVLVELLLWAAPDLPGPRLGNVLYSCYGSFPGAIYSTEPTTNVAFMWPDDRTTCYWNGYRWRHETDDRGFRNPPGTRPGVLLLGDSMVYGHGVDESRTAAHLLRSTWHVDAYNMGRQGSCLYDHYIFLRTYLDELAPRAVVLFVFINDFHDLEIYRTREQIESVPEIGRGDYRAVRQWASSLPERRPSELARWFHTRPTVRAAAGLAHALAQLGLAAPAWAAETPADQPDFVDTFYDDARLVPIGRYYERVIADLAARCREAGCDLRLVYLSAGSDKTRWDYAQRRMAALVGEVARQNGLLAYDTRPLFADCVDCFLPGDGHLAVEGHAVLARFLAESVLPGNPERAMTTKPARSPHR